MEAGSWPEAQVYTLLLIAERMPSGTISVHWAGWEDFAGILAGKLAQALGR